MLFSLHVFECFWVFSLRLISSFKPLWFKKIPDMTSISLNLLRLVLCPTMWSIFEIPHVHMKRMCILLLWGGNFCVYQLRPFDLELLIVTIALLILSLEDLSFVNNGMLKSPMMGVLLFISFLKSSNFP